MSNEEINYWLETFEETRHRFMSKDGKILSFYDIFKTMKDLQNNWNELKKWLEELDKTFCETMTRDNSEFYHFQRGELMFLRNIKLKMQELENRKV